MAEATFIEGLAGIANRYAGYVIDQWGVLHDGAAPYPGVLDCLAELRRRAKRVVLLSNSGRRADHARGLLRSLGFDLGGMAAVVTSGEAGWGILRDRALPPFDRLGRRCYLFTRDGDHEVIAGTGVTAVADPALADFLYMAGVDSPALGLEDYRPALLAGLARQLPALCANPDIQAPTVDGLVIAPGLLAAEYERLGGSVTYVGKPHAPIYQPVLAALDGLAGHEILAIGDSLIHDIAGAKGAGLDACFISSGLHAADFPAEGRPEEAMAALARLAAEHGATPDWVLPTLRW